MKQTHIFLIDDHAIFRTGLRMVLEASFEQAVILEAGALCDAINGTESQPDIVLLDIKLPGLVGTEGIELLKRKWPQTVVLMLSSLDEPEIVRLAIARGAEGFISKASSADDIIQAITRALNGQLQSGDINGLNDAGCETASQPPRLTPRQLEVLEWLCQGMSNKLIGRKLALSENTVRGHVQAILAFLMVSSRAEAAFEARRKGLVG